MKPITLQLVSLVSLKSWKFQFFTLQKIIENYGYLKLKTSLLLKEFSS